MDERARFIDAKLSGRYASMAELCEAFGVSRKTGYKWWRRFEEGGLRGLEVAPVEPLHGDVAAPLGLADVEDAHDTGVIELNGELCLAQQARAHVLAGGRELEGDGVAAPKVSRLVDGAHPARREGGTEAISPVDEDAANVRVHGRDGLVLVEGLVVAHAGGIGCGRGDVSARAPVMTRAACLISLAASVLGLIGCTFEVHGRYRDGGMRSVDPANAPECPFSAGLLHVADDRSRRSG